MRLARPSQTLDRPCPNDHPDLPPFRPPLRSERYYDDVYEYRHVVLPPEIAKRVPKGRLMSEVSQFSWAPQDPGSLAPHRPSHHPLSFAG